MEVPPHSRSMPSFLLDPVEVSVAKFRTVPPQSQVFSIYEENGIEAVDDEAIAFVNWNDAMTRAETLGKRLPDEFEYEFAATLGGTRKFPWGDDATRIVDWPIGKVGQPDWDRLPTTPPVYGLFSNVAEWTGSWPTIYPGFRNHTLQLIDNSETDRIIRGTVTSVLLDKPNPAELRAANPRVRLAIPINTWTRSIGFRCARSVKPRLKPEDFSREVP